MYSNAPVKHFELPFVSALLYNFPYLTNMFTIAKLVCHRAVSQISKHVPAFQNVSSQT